MSKKYKIVKKAWVLNPSNLEEPYFCDTDEVFLGTRGQAKQYLFRHNDAAKVLKTGEDISYLNVKVSRKRSHDKIMYNGAVISRFEIVKYERIEKLKNLDKTKMYYIQDARSYVGNAMLFWAKNSAGYTCELSRAHKYSYLEIVNSSWRETDIIWESKHIEAGVKTIVDMQRVDRDFSI